MNAKVILTFLLFASIINLNISASVPSGNAKGMEIALKMKKASDGFIGEESSMKMVLIDAYKAKAVREMEGKILEIEGDGDKSLSTFLNPKDVKGTKMLTWSHKEEDDDQWLYLPVSKRLRRISSRSKSSSFMGSEFSYEDLGSQEIEKYNFEFIKEDKLNNETIWVLNRYPKSKSGYSKQVLYVSQSKLHPLKIEYFDRKDELLKVAQFSEYKEYEINNKKMYRAGQIHMVNVQTKKESIFTWESRKLGVQHSDRVFDKNTLKK